MNIAQKGTAPFNQIESIWLRLQNTLLPPQTSTPVEPCPHFGRLNQMRSVWLNDIGIFRNTLRRGRATRPGPSLLTESNALVCWCQLVVVGEIVGRDRRQGHWRR